MTDRADIAPDEDGESTASAEAEQRLWEARLLLATRILAGLELLKGLLHWGALLGVGGGSFSSGPVTWQGTTIYFAILDLVAAVGLWMAAPWGIVIWLLAAFSQILVALVLPGEFARVWYVVVFEIAAMLAYAYVALRAAQARRP